MNLPFSAFRHAGWIAAGLFALAAIAFGALLDGYSHAVYPLALMGARAVPRAAAFNVLAFVVPGLLVAWICMRLRVVLPHASGWTARIGARMVLISAVAFAAQGVLPLDLDDMEGAISARHAAAWMLWWIAFATGGALVAIGLRASADQWQAFGTITLVAAILVPLFALVLALLLPAGIAQRIAFGAWFAWAIAANYAVSRAATSASGSSPTIPM